MDSLTDTMTCVYACDTVVSANYDLPTFLTYLRTPSFDSWYFFIDDSPNSNWEHPCRHVFVNVKDGNFVVYHGMKHHQGNPSLKLKLSLNLKVTGKGH